MTNSIMWFRRDLRLADNHALAAAIDDARDGGGAVIPLFVLDDALWERRGANRRWFLAGCLAELDDGARRPARHPPRRSRRRRGAARPRARRRRRVPGPGRRRSTAAAATTRSPRRWPPTAASSSRPTARGSCPPARCTPATAARSRCTAPTCGRGASSACRRSCAGRAPCRRSTASGPTACPPAPAVTADLPEPGEAAAHRALDRFIDVPRRHVRRQPQRPGRRRHQPAVAVPPLRGCLHPRQLLRRLDGRNPSHDTFAKELAWRDFYADVLDAWPASAWRSWNPKMAGMEVDRGDAGRRALRGVVRGEDGLPDRRRRDAPARRRGLDAQPAADDHGQLPRQGPPHRLDPWRPLLHGAPRRRRPAVEQPRLAVGRRHRDRRRAVLPHLQPDAAVGEVRPRRHVHPPLGARAGRRRRPRTSTSRRRRPAAHRPATRPRSSTTPPNATRPSPATRRCAECDALEPVGGSLRRRVASHPMPAAPAARIVIGTTPENIGTERRSVSVRSSSATSTSRRSATSAAWNIRANTAGLSD